MAGVRLLWFRTSRQYSLRRLAVRYSQAMAASEPRQCRSGFRENSILRWLEIFRNRRRLDGQLAN